MSDAAYEEAERRFPLWLPTGDYEIDREDYSELDAKWQNEDTERDRAHFVQGAEWQRQQDESERTDNSCQYESVLREIRNILSSAPECDKYSDDDTISCGWKKDMIGVRRILDESGL